MKLKLIHLSLALFIAALCYSQDATPNPKISEFAIVYLSPGGNQLQCIAKYSNGTSEDLKEKLNLPPQKNGFKMIENAELEEGYEFSILQYMHDKGYILLAKTESKYYFEHK